MSKLFRLEASDLQSLIDALLKRDYTVIAPTVQERAIVYDIIDSVNALPVGIGDEQGPGRYRLVERDDDAFFGYVVGPHAWKQHLFPPHVTLWRAQRDEDGFVIEDVPVAAPRMAFLGVRPCELAAIEVQDRVFLGTEYVDPTYAARRENAFIVAVNCGEPGELCFCASMDTGPEARSGFDLSLTEIISSTEHFFVATVGSEAGKVVLADTPAIVASHFDIESAENILSQAAQNMGRTLATDGLAETLADSYTHPRWQEVAERCLSCANCTQVCPTCFCSTVEDVTDLTGDSAERQRYWDSCFTSDFSYIHGGSIRPSGMSRYRQWLIHKLSTWQDQFGTSGCVGCGRCIAWCPVGIDLTVEAAAICGVAEAETDKIPVLA
jgi:ferredoxin